MEFLGPTVDPGSGWLKGSSVTVEGEFYLEIELTHEMFGVYGIEEPSVERTDNFTISALVAKNSKQLCGTLVLIIHKRKNVGQGICEWVFFLGLFALCGILTYNWLF